MKPSQACIDFIKEFEGFRAKAYLCSAGVPSVGYGHTEYVDLGDEVTEEEAEELLRQDVQEAADAIDDLVEVELTQNQYDAIASFVYNIGREAFRNSTLLRLINADCIDAAAAQFGRWNKAGGVVVAGLTRRREREREMFES